MASASDAYGARGVIGPWPAPVRDQERPSRAQPRSELSRKWRADQRRAGNCVQCYQPRGEGGTKDTCRPCADRQSFRMRRLRWERIARGECFRCGGERGPDGTGSMCRRCSNDANTRHARRFKSRYAERRAAGRCVRCGKPARSLGTLPWMFVRCSTCMTSDAEGKRRRKAVAPGMGRPGAASAS